MPLGQGSTIVGMNEIEHLSTRIAAFCEETQVPGFVAGIFRARDQTVVAHGVANLTTGASMREDTGFLFGSITKITSTSVRRPASCRLRLSN